jgi:CheY-like chemotaxis protein
VEIDEMDASPAEALSRRMVARDAALTLDSLHILLAEDDDADAYLITRALAKNPKVGVVARARDGLEALELLDKGVIAPGLAIIDLHMPRRSGFSLLVDLAMREGANFPSAVLTSSVASADQIRSKLRGATYFLTKPTSVEELESALSQLIDAV